MNDNVENFPPLAELSVFDHAIMTAGQLAPLLAAVAAITLLVSIVLLAFKTREAGRILILAGAAIAVFQLGQHYFFPLSGLGSGLVYSSVLRLGSALSALLFAFGFAQLTWAAIKRQRT